MEVVSEDHHGSLVLILVSLGFRLGVFGSSILGGVPNINLVEPEVVEVGDDGVDFWVFHVGDRQYMMHRWGSFTSLIYDNLPSLKAYPRSKSPTRGSEKQGLPALVRVVGKAILVNRLGCRVSRHNVRPIALQLFGLAGRADLAQRDAVPVINPEGRLTATARTGIEVIHKEEYGWFILDCKFILPLKEINLLPAGKRGGQIPRGIAFGVWLRLAETIEAGEGASRIKGGLIDLYHEV